MGELTILNEKFYAPIKQNFIKLANEKTFSREVGFAVQIIKGNTGLQKCDAESVLQAVYNISQTGLSLNPVLNYAYLVPRKGKCCLDPGYQGLIKLATDAGAVGSISVQLVYEGDQCEIDLASPEKIKKHVPYQVLGNEKGKILYGYSVAALKDDTRHVEIMSIKDMYDIREYSEGYKAYLKDKPNKAWLTNPWADNEAEMCRKTIVRRHFKYLPKSDSKQLEKAIELDNADYDFPMTYEQGNYIEELLFTSTLEGKLEKQIHSALAEGMTQKRAEEFISYLQENQKDNIDGGGYYNQTDIQKKLSSLKEQ